MISAEEMARTARMSFETGKTKFLNFRKTQLQAFIRLIEENKNILFEALQNDLRKPKWEIFIIEIEETLEEAKFCLSQLFNWTAPEIPEKMMVNIFDTMQIVREPYGVVLIFGSSYYPIRLLLVPFIGALAAGNVVILKPSELAPHSAEIIAKLIPKYLDKTCFHVFLGDVAETTELLKEKFDYVFFTGSTVVGKIIYEACAKNLTPATLELGGKCPVYLHESADIAIATRRILWGKFINCGQSCIAPDYLLCDRKTEEKFLKYAKITLRQFFGDDPRMSQDYGRIINEKQFIRLQRLMVGLDVAIGGRVYPQDSYIEPTILTKVKSSSPIMKEEILGPILPILNVESVMEAIKLINSKEKPLTVYIFSSDQGVVSNFIRNTSSGGVTVNDTMRHMSCDSLPFGGVGSSGMGRYQGNYTFDTFSNKKSILITDFKQWKENKHSVKYPPSNEEKFQTLLKYTQKRKMWSFKYGFCVLAFLVGYLLAIIL